ncbi:MAG: cytochrome b N-terminal domain-containing protein [Armatimonadetes bacterium]|nr:cytochrome b N-terminal domain-containing protein [Armatimonadota bacterium]
MYKRWLRALQRATLRVDVFINRVYPSEWNPLYFTGGLGNLFLVVLVLSGIFIFLYYMPSIDSAHNSVSYLTERVPYGGLIRGIHRYAADGFMLAILLHLFRNWFTDRYLFSRDSPWISGMFLLGFAGFVGVNGYMMAWDDRGQALLAMTVRVLESINLRLPFLVITTHPLGFGGIEWVHVGRATADLLTAGPGIGEGTLVRLLYMHVVPASTLFLLLWWHYVRLRHPKIWPPATWVLFCLGAVTFFAAVVPAVSGTPAQPAGKPAAFPLDVFYLLPYWLLKFMGPVVVVVLGVAVFAYGFYIPYQMREEQIEPLRHAGKAIVIEPNCTGCELCYYDCPYNAIVMASSPRPGQTRAAANRKLVAIVLDSRCVECGICIGACPFQALELPQITEAQIQEKVLAACRT